MKPDAIPCAVCGSNEGLDLMLLPDASVAHYGCARRPIFVYGTLRQGGVLEASYIPADAPREAATGRGTMIVAAHGAFPAVDFDRPAGPIVGEVVELDMTRPDHRYASDRLDILEAAYDVRQVAVRMGDGSERIVDAYHRAERGERVDDGDFIRWYAERHPAYDDDEPVLVRVNINGFAEWYVADPTDPETPISPTFVSPSKVGRWCKTEGITLSRQKAIHLDPEEETAA